MIRFGFVLCLYFISFFLLVVGAVGGACINNYTVFLLGFAPDTPLFFPDVNHENGRRGSTPCTNHCTKGTLFTSGLLYFMSTFFLHIKLVGGGTFLLCTVKKAFVLWMCVFFVPFY